jgi:TRAP-type C4-dicarboxylate transport system permease small subunit
MMEKILERLHKSEKFVASVLIFVLTVFVVLDVASREIYQRGIPWAQKGAVYLMIWAGFIGAILVTHKVEHLRPEIADKLWKGKSKNFYLRFHNFLVFCFTLSMTYYSVLYVLESKEFGDRNVIIDVAMWVLQLIIPYAFASMSLRYLFFIFFPREKNPGAVH